MDYRYESLGPNRFQALCGALISKEFPDVQCFPTGQADGGRDITSHSSRKPSAFVTFQAKYTEQPDRVRDAYEWIKAVVDEEAPKVARLVQRGLTAYRVVTNVRGTGRQDVGSIDRVNAMLTERLQVPSACWWRDDLDRRLDGDWDLKWSYPELLSGRDVIGILVTRGRTTEADSQRSDAVKAYVRTQYSADQQVRFKQVELQNALLSLFVDVPLSVREQRDAGKTPEEQLWIQSLVGMLAQEQAADRSGSEAMLGATLDEYGEADPYVHGSKHRLAQVGTAALLLNERTQKLLPRVVLEGAPGQGKSTLAQYVCQIHRIRLLGDSLLGGSQHAGRVTGPLRIPFKADLRDLALWLNGTNPFSSQHEPRENSDEESVEAFLAAQVRHLSGGMAFTVADLHTIARQSPVFLVFDGLDEVADIRTRQMIVEQVTMGVRRLGDSAQSLQVLVTSRPAAYANSPGFSEEYFRYCDLASLSKRLILDYATRWARAKGLGQREEHEVITILNAKMTEPHTRDLARNPMQLSILLSLIHTRGASLPDKRTALYDSYVELFLNREAEKSEVVREHRDLLVDIHQYLAWLLHSEAERGQGRGSIARDRLLSLLRDYLREEGHNPKLAEELFQGMVERVVALVSRVEGTYEFEVQPLREYFCARYLYETAPYSPPGAERTGTKTDRFEAVARSFYWLNVARFYAGCYSKGELPSLVASLKDLLEDEKYQLLSHPRVLGVMLLGDWVFSQHILAMNELLTLVMDPLAIRLALSGSAVVARSPTRLPEKCGRQDLVDRLLGLLTEQPADESADEIIDLLNANADKRPLAAWWLEHCLSSRTDKRTVWIDYGSRLGLVATLDLKVMASILSDGLDVEQRVPSLLAGGQFRYFEQTGDQAQQAIDAVLDGRWWGWTAESPSEHLLTRFARSFNLLRQFRILFPSLGRIHNEYFREMATPTDDDVNALSPDARAKFEPISSFLH